MQPRERGDKVNALCHDGRVRAATLMSGRRPGTTPARVWHGIIPVAGFVYLDEHQRYRFGVHEG